MIHRARGSGSRPAGRDPARGDAQDKAAPDSAGPNSAGPNGAGLNGAGPTGAGQDEAGLNGVGLSGGRPVGADCPAAVSLGLTHRIYPDGRAVAAISGELDAATADQAKDYVRQVIDRSKGPVSLDLAGLSFCDARGLRTLVAMASYARAAGRRLKLVSPRPAIVKIMRITGVDANFPELDHQPGSQFSPH